MPAMRKIYLVGLLLLSACAYRSPWADKLAGHDETYVIQALGKPTVRRTESPNQIWAYKTGTCSTLIYFDDNGRVRFVDTSGDCPSE